MELGLAFAAYLLIALYFYQQQKSFWQNAIRFIKESTPIPDNWLVLPFFILFLLLPLLMLQQKVVGWLERLGLKQAGPEETPEEVQLFLERYYPELDQGLDPVCVVLERSEYPLFLVGLLPLFEGGFDERTLFTLERALQRLADGGADEEKFSFSVSHAGRRLPLVVQVEREEGDANRYLLTFYTAWPLLAALDVAIDRYCRNEPEEES